MNCTVEQGEQLLAALMKSCDLNQGDVLAMLAHLQRDAPDADPRFSEAEQRARDEYAEDDLEIDDEPLFSESDDGVWVAAWVWVAMPTGQEPEEDAA